MSAEPERALGAVIDDFVGQIDSLRTSLALAMLTISEVHRTVFKSYDEFITKNCTKEKREEKEFVVVSIEHQHRYNVLNKRVQQTSIAHRVVPRSFLVSLVSQFDAFLGSLVSALLRMKPELLKSSERSLTFSQLREFKSIEEATEYVLEKEIETLLRKSHAEQFEWLEKKFDINLRVDLPVWPTFIELTERRNLFVHSDGMISSQYLKVCREHGFPLNSGLKV